MVQVNNLINEIIQPFRIEIGGRSISKHDEGNPMWHMTAHYMIAILTAFHARKWAPWALWTKGIGLGLLLGPLVAQSFHFFFCPGPNVVIPTDGLD